MGLSLNMALTTESRGKGSIRVKATGHAMNTWLMAIGHIPVVINATHRCGSNKRRSDKCLRASISQYASHLEPVC